jgi:hypothetical protein
VLCPTTCLTNVDWSEALKLWWLEAHARAVRRGNVTPLAVPTPEPTLELPPLYDAELHTQIKADIARLCGPTRPLMPKTSNGQGSRRRRVQSVPTAEGGALERDPTYLAQMSARKAMLQAQAVLLRAQASDLEVGGTAD